MPTNAAAPQTDHTAPTASTGSSTSPSAMDRSELAIRVSAMLSQFWTEDSPNEIRAIEIEGWIDALGSITSHEFRAAWASYQQDGPRSATGRLVRPDAGAIHRFINRGRADHHSATAPPPPRRTGPLREIVTAEQRARIMAEVGLTQARLAAVEAGK